MTPEQRAATDDRVRPMLLAQAEYRHAFDWGYEDVEPVVATLLAERDAAQAEIARLTTPDTITLPRAEVEALMEAADALDDEYCSQQYGPSLHAIDKMRMALLALQERLK